MVNFGAESIVAIETGQSAVSGIHPHEVDCFVVFTMLKRLQNLSIATDEIGILNIDDGHLKVNRNGQLTHA